MSQTQIIICIQKHALPLHFFFGGGILIQPIPLETRDHPLILPEQEALCGAQSQALGIMT